MFADLDFNTWDTRFALLGILLATNLLLKWRGFRAPLDYDTSNHLYFVHLTYRRIPFISSYNFGVKYLLPRLYRIGMGWIKDHPYRFRIFNIVSSSLVLMLWVVSDPDLTPAKLPFYFLGVCLINSLWINYLTSASEFHSVVLVMAIFLLPDALPFPIVWGIQIALLMVLIGGFKLVNAAYILPLLAFQIDKLIEFPWWTGLGLGLFVLFIISGLKSAFKPTRQYSSTRKLFTSKNTRFLLCNPHFCLFVGLLGLGNILWTSWEWPLLQITVWIILLVQRSYIAYFFYPSLVLGFFTAFQNQWLDTIPPFWGWVLVAAVFLGHTALHLLFLSPREIDIRFRQWICFQGWRSYLEKRDLQVDWLKSNLEDDADVYLWGSNVPLLLLANLAHSPHTYYSHTHLIHWSQIGDKQNYAIHNLRKHKPKYVIESAVIDNLKFPADQLSDLYEKIHAIENMSVYRRK